MGVSENGVYPQLCHFNSEHEVLNHHILWFSCKFSDKTMVFHQFSRGCSPFSSIFHLVMYPRPDVWLSKIASTTAAKASQMVAKFSRRSSPPGRFRRDQPGFSRRIWDLTSKNGISATKNREFMIHLWFMIHDSWFIYHLWFLPFLYAFYK